VIHVGSVDFCLPLIRFGSSVTVPENKVIENAHAFGGILVFLINLFGLGAILLWQLDREKPQMAG
jgi:hypothetical protein